MEIRFKLFCAILGAFYICIYYMYFIVLYKKKYFDLFF